MTITDALTTAGQTIYVDIDNTICTTPSTEYSQAEPMADRILVINSLASHHTIVYWTARGTVSGIDFRKLTERQLAEWGVEYDRLLMGKPAFDLLIDDKAFNSEHIEELAV